MYQSFTGLIKVVCIVHHHNIDISLTNNYACYTSILYYDRNDVHRIINGVIIYYYV